MIAAVTLCTSILLIIMSVSSIFGMGGNSVIARLLGEEKNKEVRSTLNFCLYAMVFAGIFILIAGILFMKPIAAISGADAENMAYTYDYLKYIFLGAPFIILSNGLVHLFRSLVRKPDRQYGGSGGIHTGRHPGKVSVYSGKGNGYLGK